jgi:hypothetical protein
MLGDLQEAQRYRFSDRQGYAVAVDAVALEVLVGDRQAAVIVAAVVTKLDLDATDNTMC